MLNGKEGGKEEAPSPIYCVTSGYLFCFVLFFQDAREQSSDFSNGGGKDMYTGSLSRGSDTRTQPFRLQIFSEHLLCVRHYVRICSTTEVTVKVFSSWSLHPSHRDNEQVNKIIMDCKTCSGRGKKGSEIVHMWGRPILNLVGGH